MTGHVGRPFGTLKELNFAGTTLRKCHSFGGDPQNFFLPAKCKYLFISNKYLTTHILFSWANRKISLSIFLGFFAATCKTF